jgi:hypothetical protein
MYTYEERLNRAARRCSEIMDILVDTLERAPEIHQGRVMDVAASTEQLRQSIISLRDRLAG